MKTDMVCAECGSTMKKQVVTHHYLESGLKNVYLDKISVYECPKCGERYVHIPNPVQLHIVMAISFAFKDGLLAGPEIKFMRKEIGMSGKAFAGYIGVTPVTLSRWETGEIKQSPAHDNLIRFAFKQMMCERLRTIVSFMEERIRKAKVISFKRSRIDVDTERLKIVALPELAHDQRSCA